MPTSPTAVLPLKDRVALSVHEAAALSGLKVTTLQKAMATGLLESAKIGRRRLITPEALQAFIASGVRAPLRVDAAYNEHRAALLRPKRGKRGGP